MARDRDATGRFNHSLLIIKVYEKDVSPRTVFRDPEEIHNTLEAAFPGQRPSDIRQHDRKYRSNNDVAVTQAITAAYFDVTTLPNPNGPGNFAPTDPIAKLFSEDHDRLIPQESTAS